jgi:hypothetical protein
LTGIEEARALKDGANIADPNSIVNSQRGARWADAYMVYTGFHTILPPNHVNVAGSGKQTEHQLCAATSYHTGGVQIGLGDGSVTFVSDTINCMINGYSTLVTNGTLSYGNSGQSHYGIWGALGTRNGGESAAP